MSTSNHCMKTILHCFIICTAIKATQFVYNSDFTASSYSRIGGFSGAQIDYDASTLSTTLFDGLAIGGDITINGNDYFFLQINFADPIDLHSAQLIWRPIGARAATNNANAFIFTKISYFNLFNETYDTLPISQSQWDPIVADYVLFKADTVSYDLLFTNTIIFQLTFRNYSISEIHLTLTTIAGEYYTWAPTDSPTNNPSQTPTFIPTLSPTPNPSKSPSNIPTHTPTLKPTKSPTFTIYARKTDNFSLSHSLNIYPLSYRNETLFNFTVPGTKPYCLTCILAWSDIDASIEVIGCDTDITHTTDVIPNSFYACDTGVWVLKSSAKLADWQQTYGKIEIWEIDTNEIEYLQYRLEFQWNVSVCTWFNHTTQTIVPCPLLPLTISTATTNSNERTAVFEFRMPKHFGDNRHSPLIVVWYDLLSIPYSVRPKLNYNYHNLSLMNVGKGQQFGVKHLWHNFKDGIIGAAILIASFLFITVIACFIGQDKTDKKELMLKTYNLRSVYRQSRDNEILPRKHAKNKSKFICKRHGPWLVTVFIARLIYMAVFTLSFFFLVFQTINHEWFDVLSKYDAFAQNRDSELGIISSNIEAYYTNETEKMDSEIKHRQKYCYTDYINETQIEWNKGALAQYNNHSTQMYEKSQKVNMRQLNKTDTIYIKGDTACDIIPTNGAHILESDPMRKVFVFPNGTYKNTTYWKASEYDRNWDNFTEIEQILIDRCLQQQWCMGWTWIDPNMTVSNDTRTAHYHLLSSLSEPINSADMSGVCYAVSRYDPNEFDFSSNIDLLQNRTDILREEYMNDYQTQIETMSESLNGIWKALQSLGDDDSENGDHSSYTVIVNNDPSATGHDIDIQLNEMLFTTSSQGATQWQSSWYVIVTCPGCPEGKNFTSPHLREVYDYIFGLNASNITDYLSNGSVNGPLPVNISNLVSINPAIIAYPNLPTLDFPLKFDIPLYWPTIIGISAALDVVLLVYRWYRTVGILARIIRGKDVEIALRHIKVRKKDQKCCKGRQVSDKLLSAVMFAHDKCYYIRYNLFKMCYWLTVVLQLFVVACLILVLYIIVDQILTVDFINDMGTFTLMTAGIAAQRAVRNQVLSTTALSYNNYTLSNIEETSQDFAAEKNRESWDWNIKELQRVDEWNAYFCTAFTSYMSLTRDISANDGNFNILLPSNQSFSLFHALFDGNSNTSFVFESTTNQSNQSITVDIELPQIQFTDSQFSFWEISQVQIEWNYYYFDSNLSSNAYIQCKIYTKLDSDSNHWIEHSKNEYFGAQYSKLSDIQSINMHLNETRFMRFEFQTQTQNTKFNSFSINEITVFGSAPVHKIVCDKVEFHLWSFDASKIHTNECPNITPVFGNMYRGFVRALISVQLLEAHKPFISAIRNIVLSPFFILFAAILALMVVYALALIVEWLLIRFNLFRENIYSRVTLVSTKWSEYDSDKHYITTGNCSSDSDSDDSHSHSQDCDDCGGDISFVSPEPKIKKDREKQYFYSPNNNQSLSIISPRLIEMEQIILRSAKKVKDKIKRLASPQLGRVGNGTDQKPLLAQTTIIDRARDDGNNNIDSEDSIQIEYYEEDGDYEENNEDNVDRCKQQ